MLQHRSKSKIFAHCGVFVGWNEMSMMYCVVLTLSFSVAKNLQNFANVATPRRLPIERHPRGVPVDEGGRRQLELPELPVHVLAAGHPREERFDLW